MSIVLWTAVVLIGGAGSVLRFLGDGVVASAAGRDFPLGTLAVNVSGAVILGLLTGLALGHDEALLTGTAAVGSYTTFSTWMLETQRLTEEREHGKAALNVAASLAAGVAAANERLARVQQVKQWRLLPVEWTAETEELTPTLKLKRRVVHAKYADVIDSLYAG